MKILVAGDFCPQNRVAKLFDEEKYDSVLGDVKGIIKNADYSIVNFECPIKLGGETPNMNRLSLYCSENGMKAAAHAGFNCVTLANNHFRDWGEGGVLSTLKTCEKYGLDYVGGGNNISHASKTLYKRIGNRVLAIINCCEHEFSLATSERGGSNPLNPIHQYYAIKEAKSKADHVIVIVHGGHEHYQLPSVRMVDTYRFFVDAGADAIINHHQHCFSGYEIYNGKPIFYGVGNFCFDMVNPPTEMWYEGYAVELFLDNNIEFSILPFTQCKEEVKVSFKALSSIQSRLDVLNEILSDKEKLRKATNKYFSESCNEVKNIMFPFQAGYIRALWTRGLFPRVLTKKWLMYMCNYVMCESHRDKMEFFFEKNIY